MGDTKNFVKDSSFFPVPTSSSLTSPSEQAHTWSLSRAES